MITVDFLKEKGITDETVANSIIEAYNTSISTESTKAVSNMLNGLDEVLFKTTGIKREPNVKTSEYAVKALEAHYTKQFNQLIQEKEAKIAELDELIKKGAPEKVINENKALQAELEKERKAHAEYKEMTVKEKKQFEQNLLINSKMPVNFQKNYAQDYIEFRKKQLLDKIATYQLDKNDKNEDIIKLGEAEGFRTILLSQYLSENLKDIIETQQAAGGSGSSGDNKGGGNNSEIIISDIQQGDSPYVIETKIREGLKKHGINPSDGRYPDEFQKLRAKYLLTKN